VCMRLCGMCAHVFLRMCVCGDEKVLSYEQTSSLFLGHNRLSIDLSTRHPSTSIVEFVLSNRTPADQGQGMGWSGMNTPETVFFHRSEGSV
jgi:hypothetical protein